MSNKKPSNIINMEGEKVKSSAPFEDQDIKRTLKHYADLNKKGLLRSIGIAACTMDGSTDHSFIVTVNNHSGTLLGSIEFLKDRILMNAREDYRVYDNV